MRISSISIRNFRRFAELQIHDIPESAKLVFLVGPNGCGKSSLFDAFLTIYRSHAQHGLVSDKSYFDHFESEEAHAINRLQIKFHNGERFSRGKLYFRTAHRHDPDFANSTIQKRGDILANLALQRFIDADATVSQNYQRLTLQAIEDLFVNADPNQTIGNYKDEIIGQVRDPLNRLFPDLILLGMGSPLDKGTFQFRKGETTGFDYKTRLSP